MRTRLFITFLFVTILFFIETKTKAYANSTWENCLYDGAATIQCFVPLFGSIVTAIVQIAGVALFIMFIISGYNFLMSGGNPKQLEQAKNTLTYAIIGVVVIVSAYLILLIIGQFTGVDVTRFEIPDRLNDSSRTQTNKVI